MKVQSNSRLVFFILALGLLAGVILIFLTQNSYGGGDHFNHYKLAHWGWKYPNVLFNHWGKPVFTILISPFAQFGINGARIYNLVMGLLTAMIVWKLAGVLNFKNRLLSLLLVLFTPVYFILMFTSLTEVSFSFFLAVSTLLFFKQRYLASAIVLSFLPLLRSEGIVLFPLFILAYSFKRQWLSIPLLSIGFLVISLFGFPFYESFFWLITEMPYSGSAKDIYGSGPLLHFIYHNSEILGSPIAILFIVGFGITVVTWIAKDKLQISNTFYFLLLIPGSFLTFLVAHSYVWWQGIGNSLGLVRVIGSVTPFAALTALVGFNYLLSWFWNNHKVIAVIIATPLLIWIVRLGILTHQTGFKLSDPQQVVGRVADYIRAEHLDKYKLFYFNPYLIINIDIDPYDESRSGWGVPDKLNPSNYIPDSSIIVWDAHFGPNEGRLPLERLKNSDELTLLNVFRPVQPFKVLGGYDYAIYIFQKTSGQKKVHDQSDPHTIQEWYFDFETNDHADSSFSYTGKYSLKIAPKQQYVNFLTLPAVELSPLLKPIKIEFSAELHSANELSEHYPIVVCTLTEDGKNVMYQAFQLQKNADSLALWQNEKRSINIYVIPSRNTLLKLYLWNKESALFRIDDVRIRVNYIDMANE